MCAKVLVYACKMSDLARIFSVALAYLVQQQNWQDLTYITIDHSRPRPIYVPNENLDVQYTSVKHESAVSTV